MKPNTTVLYSERERDENDIVPVGVSSRGGGEL